MMRSCQLASISQIHNGFLVSYEKANGDDPTKNDYHIEEVSEFFATPEEVSAKIACILKNSCSISRAKKVLYEGLAKFESPKACGSVGKCGKLKEGARAAVAMRRSR
jgi:hypothetical protein